MTAFWRKAAFVLSTLWQGVGVESRKRALHSKVITTMRIAMVFAGM
jgi:hypothetical protein